MALLEVLSELADVEWARSGSAQDWPDQFRQPPLIVWRFKSPNGPLEASIKKAVEGFRGEVEWEAYFGRRNWVIAPKRVRQFLAEHSYRTDAEALNALAEDDPSFGESANRDVPRLAEHIRSQLKGVEGHQ